MKLKNLYLALKAQLPLRRMFHNFVVTRNAWGLLSKYSHENKNGAPKVSYSEKSARRAADRMGKKFGVHFSVYKCLWCDGWHIGKNRTSVKEKHNG
jgi:hypothetical protein